MSTSTTSGLRRSMWSRSPMAMTRSEVMRRLQPIFDDLFAEKVELTPELTAADVAGWDSLRHIALLMAIEEAFSVRFHVGEVDAVTNVGEFADVIARRSTGLQSSRPTAMTRSEVIARLQPIFDNLFMEKVE